MPKSNSWVSDVLNLLFKNVAAANIGDAGGLQPSAAAGSLYLSLHTAAPGVAGDQTTNEVSYTGYARVAVARSAVGWTVAGTPATAVLAALQAFGQRTDGGAAIEALYIGIGTSSAGAGKLLYYGAIVGANTALAATGAAATDKLTVPGSAFSVNDRIVLSKAGQSTVPAGLAVDTVYYIKTVSGTDYTLSTTAGGATIDITADGAALVQKLSPITIALNSIPQLTTSTTILEL